MRAAETYLGWLGVFGLVLLAGWAVASVRSDSAAAQRFPLRQTAKPQSAPVATLVTGYPFYFAGSGQRRYVARGRDERERR